MKNPLPTRERPSVMRWAFSQINWRLAAVRIVFTVAIIVLSKAFVPMGDSPDQKTISFYCVLIGFLFADPMEAIVERVALWRFILRFGLYAGMMLCFAFVVFV
ncbi:MAG: hypothetical protein AAGH42_00910 [Pseudomonadota bacterium]